MTASEFGLQFWEWAVVYGTIAKAIVDSLKALIPGLQGWITRVVALVVCEVLANTKGVSAYHIVLGAAATAIALGVYHVPQALRSLRGNTS